MAVWEAAVKVADLVEEGWAGVSAAVAREGRRVAELGAERAVAAQVEAVKAVGTEAAAKVAVAKAVAT